MTAPTQDAPPKGWRDLTPEERKALSPAERSRARLRDIKSKEAAEKRRLARVEKLASEGERKRDARRKILIGAVVETWAQRTSKPGSDRVKWLNDLLDAELVRDDDRALFGFAVRNGPRPHEEPAQPPAA